MSDDLCFVGGRELASMLRARKVSAREVMTAYLRQIARVNPDVNAIVAKLDDDRCLELADEADRTLGRKLPVGLLHGLPWAFKDLENAVGFPATNGSTIYRNNLPAADSLLVERVRRAGVLPIGKTNVPEFGMGSHTYNEVYGTTFNAFDLRRTAGGSSGGAGVALATGMLPLADGSDFGGSLRNPANFNNIVGFRPSVGLVPSMPTVLPLLGFAVKGPMGRTVSDAAFLLSVMAGADARDPGTYPSTPSDFGKPLVRNMKGTRIAWCPDLGGLPLDQRVRGVLDGQRRTFEDLGCVVEDVAPDLRDADEVFLTIRRWRSWITYASLLTSNRAQLKPEAVAEIDAGAALTSHEVAQAFVKHAQLLERIRVFQQAHEFIVCAVNQLPPFDATIDWPHEIEGMRMQHYIEWMKSAYLISATWCPAISVPAGFTMDGLPVGIQIVGRYREDFSVMQLAYVFEQATNVGRRRPAIAAAE